MTIESVPPVKNNTLGLIGMIAGIVAVVSLLAGCCVLPVVGQVFAIIFGLAALIMGFIARKQIKESDGEQGGSGMALAALIMGGAALVIGVLLAILAIVGVSIAGLSGLIDY
ncbi:MAG: DUF4190 domain-containing protein [Anaerolineaceae bacterium]|nr:DUF4190 domain-containing protein [Anaerolineaceae bacterium]